MGRIAFETSPDRYRHWRLNCDGDVANLVMDVDPSAGLFPGCELKLNSYDLRVDIELHDAVQRLRFEHPEVRVVVLRSGKDNVFCSGANIRMLASADHAHKVNFCKFTNETRLAIEDASRHSGQIYIAAVSGACAGGGYELALAADYIMLIDDRRSSVSLPEAPLLAVLPGTGGLTRLTDKRRVRRDRADAFCTTEEGVRGQRAVDWRLVDEVVPPSVWETRVRQRAAALAAKSDRPRGARGIVLKPLERRTEGSAIIYSHVRIDCEPAAQRATITVRAPAPQASLSVDEIHSLGAAFWPLLVARELDDALLHLRFNEPGLSLVLLRCEGDAEAVLEVDTALDRYQDDWLVREITLYLKRILKRLDLTSRSLIAVVEPGSCFAGTLAELAFAADRAVMLSGTLEGDNRPPAALHLSTLNFGAYPMGNGLSRLETRLIGEPETMKLIGARVGEPIEADDAEALGLVTRAYDEIDWDDELRVMLEERASFSPDVLTALEANLRFAGPETMETRIFGRLTAWQNWVFQRPNAVGEQGALKRYGSGVKPAYDRKRV